ncbi:MAG: peptidase U32 family protein [Bilophila sp.]
MNTTLPELLAPVGGREQLEAAILYGADAVYLGGPEMSLRTSCSGFCGVELQQAVRDAHSAGVRVYYCLNAMPYDRQLTAVQAALEGLPELGVDGLILADAGVLRMARRVCPDISIHLSTQAHTVNRESVAFWQEAGVERVNLARELDIRAIRELVGAFPGFEFEVFVHGAMCLALSGHCLLSAWVNDRPANQGRCTQPCRFEYRGVALSVEEQMRSGEPLWEIQEGEAFSSIWAPQDLCLIRYIRWLARSGVRALKLEGRTKSGGYVAQVVDVYRSALKQLTTPLATLRTADCVRELFHTASRPLSTGFFLSRRRVEARPEGFLSRPVVARLMQPLDASSWQIQVRSPWFADRDASILLPGMRRPALRPGSYRLENHRGERVAVLHPGMDGVLHCDKPVEGLTPGLYVRA